MHMRENDLTLGPQICLVKVAEPTDPSSTIFIGKLDEYRYRISFQFYVLNVPMLIIKALK
jgi:hypothetical protein